MISKGKTVCWKLKVLKISIQFDTTLNFVYFLLSVRTLEKAKTSGNYGVEGGDGKDPTFNETESDTSDIEGTIHPRRPKKLKVGNYN